MKVLQSQIFEIEIKGNMTRMTLRERNSKLI